MALKKFLSLFFFFFSYQCLHHNLLLFYSSLASKAFFFFKPFSVSNKMSTQLYSCSPPGVGESWGDDRPHDPSILPVAGLCVTLPLLSRQQNCTCLCDNSRKTCDIFTLSSYLQSKHISAFTTEHFHREAWNRLEMDPEHSLSFAGKPPHSINWDWTVSCSDLDLSWSWQCCGRDVLLCLSLLHGSLWQKNLSKILDILQINMHKK